MKNPNSRGKRLKKRLTERWSEPDYEGGEPRIQLKLIARDILIFILLPLFSVIAFKMCENTFLGKKPKTDSSRASQEQQNPIESSKSQIIEFKSNTVSQSPLSGISRRSPGSLVKVRLMNVVETYSTAPVHAQIIDQGLGNNLLGGTLIGDATPDATFERINITFKFVRDPSRQNVAIPVAARALSLDGTLGLNATKKEGFVARSAIGSAGNVAKDIQGKGESDSVNFQQVIFRALTAGLLQEFGSGTDVERNRSQVLTLKPSTVFFVELTDFFPGGSR